MSFEKPIIRKEIQNKTSNNKSKLNEGLSAKDTEIKRLEILLNPRLWNREMQTAWHENLPDIQASFNALKECGR